MVTPIDRVEVLHLLETGGQVVDVLPSREYEAAHIPGAISLPLKQLNRVSSAALRRDDPVIVYCHDGL